MSVSAASRTLDEEDPAVVAGDTGDEPLAAACIRTNPDILEVPSWTLQKIVGARSCRSAIVGDIFCAPSDGRGAN